LPVILRFICIALLMIMAALVIPDLRFGGRYLILAEALLSALLVWLFRKLIGMKISCLKRNFFTGFGMVITLFLGKTLFYSVNLTILGILALYLGTVLLEFVLPDYVKGCTRYSEKEEKFWKH
jgi:hypothetical protein